jgi:hypothetical protein
MRKQLVAFQKWPPTYWENDSLDFSIAFEYFIFVTHLLKKKRLTVIKRRGVTLVSLLSLQQEAGYQPQKSSRPMYESSLTESSSATPSKILRVPLSASSKDTNTPGRWVHGSAT